jgi:hypothetical protein
VTARRLRNIVVECFAPQYLINRGALAAHLQRLAPGLPANEFNQFLLLFTSRVNPILGDFIRQVYWARYTGGCVEIGNNDAHAFVARAIDDGLTVKRWSESTVRRVSAYLTGCCADYGLLEAGRKSHRRILPFRLSCRLAAYLAYDLHFAGGGDNALLNHPDWGLFGLGREDVLEEMKKLSLKACSSCRRRVTSSASVGNTPTWRRCAMSSLKADFDELCERIRHGRELGHASFEPIYYLIFVWTPRRIWTDFGNSWRATTTSTALSKTSSVPSSARGRNGGGNGWKRSGPRTMKTPRVFPGRSRCRPR